MGILPKSPFLIVLWILVVVVMSTIFGPVALGQDVPPGQSCLRLEQPSGLCKNGCPGGYWILSSRHCPQHGNACCCRMAYMYIDEKGIVDRRSEAEWHQTLSPGVPLCMIIHGSFTGWRGVFRASREMSHWIRQGMPDRPLHVAFFTWPSEAPFALVVPVVDVGLLGRRSAFNGIYLARVVARIPGDHPISFFGHSHGARAVCAALHLLGGGSVQGHRLGPPLPERPYRAVLAAAALDHHWIVPGERYGQTMVRADSLLNLVNTHDIALKLYPLRRPFSSRALGRSGLTRKDRRLLGPLAAKAAELNVTDLVGTGHLWENYFRRPQISRAVAPFIFFNDRPGTAAIRRPSASISSAD